MANTSIESMKQFISISLLTVLVAVACNVQKNVEYDFPTAMLPHVKTEYQKICDKGQALYKINCAKCHNIKVKSRQLIPDFKPEALKGYELRVSNAQHESSMPDTLVTAEELGIIMTFLSYKKKNNP